MKYSDTVALVILIAMMYAVVCFYTMMSVSKVITIPFLIVAVTVVMLSLRAACDRVRLQQLEKKVEMLERVRKAP